MKLDANDPIGQQILERLQHEQVIWLVTTSSDGTPQPRPVWFWWNGETFLIYSQPTAYKVRHIARSPRVALNFNSTPDGDDVVIFTGTAHIESTPVPAAEHASYLAKYAAGIPIIGMTPESYSARFSTVIRVTPEKVRGVDVL